MMRCAHGKPARTARECAALVLLRAHSTAGGGSKAPRIGSRPLVRHSDLDERPVTAPRTLRQGTNRGAGLGDFVSPEGRRSPVKRAWTPPQDVGEQLSVSASLVGLPNAGKSTLLNSLVGSKVSASSNKRHTTRRPAVGVVTDGRAQIVLTDTPGALEGAWASSGALEEFRRMSLDAAKTSAASALDDEFEAAEAAWRRENGMRAVGASGGEQSDDDDDEDDSDTDSHNAEMADRAARAAAAGWSAAAAQSAGSAPVPRLQPQLRHGPAADASRAAASALGGSDVALIVMDGARRVDGEAVGVVGRAVAACASAGALPLLVVSKADLLVGASGPATREPGYANDWDVEHSGGGGGAGQGVTWAGRGRGRGGGGRSSGPAGSRQDGGEGLAALHSRIDDLSDALEQSMMEWGLLDSRGLDALPVPHVHVVSGRTGGGLGFLRRTLCRLAVPRQWSFARDAVTDLTGPELAEEVIREKIFRSTQAEVPYRVGVEVVSWAEAEAGSLVVVHADVVVPSRAYSAMLTGRGGSALRAIAKGAERDLGRTMGRRVRILLHVGVSPSRAQRLMVTR